LFTCLGPIRHDRSIVPSTRHDPYKNNRARSRLRQPIRGPARPSMILNRGGLGLIPLVPSLVVPELAH
jgi:hypothetical protein